MRKVPVFILITSVIILAALLTSNLIGKLNLSVAGDRDKWAKLENYADFFREEIMGEENESDSKEDRSEDTSEKSADEANDAQKGSGIQVGAGLTPYGYETLQEESQRVLYREIYETLTGLMENRRISSKSVEEIDRIFQIVMSDHPEIFYVKGYTYTQYAGKDYVQYIELSGTYTMEKSEIAAMEDKIQEFTEDCLKGIQEQSDDYHKVKQIYEYLVSHTEYRLAAPENQNICSVCVYGESVCQGYAKTLQYLLNRIGIQATLVTGRVQSGEGHAWNLVWMDENPYYVDVTWGDASYQLVESGETTGTDKIPTINYDYLGVTTEQIKRTHVIDNVVELPLCVHMEDNYYVREGAYFDSYSYESVQALFEKSYAKEQGFVTLKCGNAAVYRQMKQELIENQKVFQLLRRDTRSIAYIDNQNQDTITFWL